MVGRIQKILLIIFLFFTLAQSFLGAETSLKDKIEDIVRAEDRFCDFSGVVLVAERGKIIYRGAFGLANREHRVPNSLRTKFDIGSITKTFTALAILQLIEKGQLSLSDYLDTYVRDCPLAEKHKITVHHLLTHSSGIYDYANDEEVIFKTVYIRKLNQMIPLVYGKGLISQPGEKISYTSGGYLLLGAIIEKITGINYSEYINQYILKPAGMEDSGLFFPEEVISDRATGYKQIDKDRYQNRVMLQFSGFSAGGLYCTAGDLLKYVLALQAHKLLGENYITRLFSPKAPPVSGQGSVAYGWWIENFNGLQAVYHTGGTPGFSSSLYIFPRTQHVAIVLSNKHRGTTGITDSINQLLSGQHYELANPQTVNYRKGLDLHFTGEHRKAAVLLDKVVDKKIFYRAALYYAARARILGEFDLEKAIEYLEQYIQMSDQNSQPSAAVAWWRKGVAYEKTKNFKIAILCYQQSLKLNPDLAEARASLKKLNSK